MESEGGSLTSMSLSPLVEATAVTEDGVLLEKKDIMEGSRQWPATITPAQA